MGHRDGPPAIGGEASKREVRLADPALKARRAVCVATGAHQMKSLAAEVADLHDRLETRKIIDRAKGILMAALNLSEPEAFSWIQKAAMDRRLTMKEVAQAVISPDAVPEK